MQINHLDFRPSIHPYSLTNGGIQPTDIFVCFDASSSVNSGGTDNFELCRQALIEIVNYFEPFLGPIRIGMSIFSTVPVAVLNLTDDYSLLLDAADQLPYTGGTTQIQKAFNFLIEKLDPAQTPQAREGVDKVMVLTLDGQLGSIGTEAVFRSNLFKQGTVNSTYNPNGIQGTVKMIGITSEASSVYVPGLSGTIPPVIEEEPGVGAVLVSGGGVPNEDYWFLNEFTDFIDIASSIAENTAVVDESALINSGSYTSQSIEQFVNDGTVIPFGENIQHVEKHAFFVPSTSTSTNYKYLSLNLDLNSVGNNILNSSHMGVIVEGVITYNIVTFPDSDFNEFYPPYSPISFRHTYLRTSTGFGAWKFEIKQTATYSTGNFTSGGVNGILFKLAEMGNGAFDLFNPFDLSSPILNVSSEGIGNDGNPHYVVESSIGDSIQYDFYLSEMVGGSNIKGTYVLI